MRTLPPASTNPSSAAEPSGVRGQVAELVEFATWGASVLNVRLATISVAVIVAVLLGLLSLVTIFAKTGLYETYTVLTQSMEPSIPMGSVAVVAPRDPSSLQVGDVITFTSGLPPYPTLTHRIQSIDRQDGKLIFHTRGDANLVPDPFDVHYANRGGLVVFTIPLFGYALVAASSLAGRAVLGLVLAALLGYFYLARIWRGPLHKGDGTIGSQLVTSVGLSTPSGPIEPDPTTAHRGRLRDTSYVWLAVIGWLATALAHSIQRRSGR